MVKGKSSTLLSGNKGALHVLFCVVIFITVVNSFGIWGVLRKWRFLVIIQLRLDQCVGTTAQEFRDSLNQLEADNQKVKNLRNAIALAKLEPSLIPPLKAALLVVVARQEWILNSWRLRQLKWSATGGCNKRGDFAKPLPILDYRRLPPDEMGPGILEWNGNMPSEFHMQVRHSVRYSAAKVRRSADGSHSETEKWMAVWSVSQKYEWAIID